VQSTSLLNTLVVAEERGKQQTTDKLTSTGQGRLLGQAHASWGKEVACGRQWHNGEAAHPRVDNKLLASQCGPG
jgi:hypothetical protein